VKEVEGGARFGIFEKADGVEGTLGPGMVFAYRAGIVAAKRVRTQAAVSAAACHSSRSPITGMSHVQAFGR
jgi:hypothetical protein